MSRDTSSRSNNGERPTLRTIAGITGLAMTTVSRALGDAPDISAKTKRKVRKVAAEIGYIPNRAGVRLRTGRTNVISLVLETEHDVLNMTARLIGSIAKGLSGTSYHLVMTPEIRGDDPLDAIRYIVETRSADAIIINRTQPEDPRVAYLRERGFPFVTHGRTIWAKDHAYFDYDNEAFGRMAVETLAERGRRNVLLLAPPRDQNYAGDMIRGAVAAANAHGIALTLADEITSDSSGSALSEGIEASLQNTPKLDGLISASPNATMIITPGLEAAGFTIGEDFDLFSKETIPFLKLFRPGILTLSEDVEKAGQFLAKAAIHEIAMAEEGHMQQLDQPTIQSRTNDD